jgi:hypothetical protein
LILSYSISLVGGDRLKPGEPPSKRRAAPRLNCRQRCLRIVSAGLGLTHGGDDGDHAVLSVLESSLDLLAEVSVGDLDIVLGVSVSVHQVKEALYSQLCIPSDTFQKTHILNVDELVFGSGDVGDFHVVGLDIRHLIYQDKVSRDLQKERYPRASFR